MADELTYEQALKEVWVYLQTMPQSYLSALPQQLLKNIEAQMDDTYAFELADKEGSNLSVSAGIYIESINYKFRFTEEERRKMIQGSEDLQREYDLEAYRILVAEIENYMHAYPFDLLSDTDYQYLRQGCSEALGILRTLADSILAYIPKSHIYLLRLNRDPKVEVILEDLTTDPFPPVSVDCMKILADIYCRYWAAHEFTPEDIQYKSTDQYIETIVSYLMGEDPDHSQEEDPMLKKLAYYKTLSLDEE